MLGLNHPCVFPATISRYDVLLTANQVPGNYWVTAQSAMRLGAPSGFGVLSYVGVNVSLPTTPTPQGTRAWPTVAQVKQQVRPNRNLQWRIARIIRDLIERVSVQISGCTAVATHERAHTLVNHHMTLLLPMVMPTIIVLEDT